MEVFWLCKYLSMNDQAVEMTIMQCPVIMGRVNNLLKNEFLVGTISWQKAFGLKTSVMCRICVIQLRTCIMRNYMVK